MSAIAAIAFTMVLVALGVLQAVLVSGAPLGRFAWGGQHTILPTRLRIGSLVAIGLYLIFAVTLLQRAGVIAVLPGGDWIDIAAWVVVAYAALGIPTNAISRSRLERLVMTPVATLLFLLGLVVVLAA